LHVVYQNVNAVFPGENVELTSELLQGVIYLGLPGFVLIGLTNLTNKRVEKLDLIRVVGFLSSAALLVYSLVVTGFSVLDVSVFGGCAAALLIEIIVRAICCKGRAKAIGYKAYMNSIGNKFNPLLLAIIGLALGLVAIYVGPVTDFVFNFVNDYWGLLVVTFVLLFIFELAFANENVTIIDAVSIIAIVALMVLTLYGVELVGFPTSKMPFAAGMLALVFFLRAIAYAGVEGEQSKVKLNNYYGNVYKKFDVIFPVAFAIVICGVFTLFGVYDFPIFEVEVNETISSIATIAGVGFILLLALVLIGKIKSEKVCILDYVLRFMTFTALFSIPYIVAAAMDFNSLMDNILFLVVAILYVVNFVFALIVQLIRLKYYQNVETAKVEAFDEAAFEDALNAIPTQETEESAQEEQASEEQAEEQVVYVDEDGNEIQYVDEDGNVIEEIPADQVAEDETEETTEEIVQYVDEDGNVIEEVPADAVVEEVADEANEEATEEIVQYVDEDGNVIEEVPASEIAELEADDDEEEAESEEDDEDDDDAEEEDEEVEQVQQAKEKNVLMPEVTIVDENGEPKKIKRKFNTRMMFAPYEAKEYYNDIKNYLIMYRAKGRNSARCETFRYKGLVAKVALAGKSIKVCLAIDPTSLEGTKYHYKDVSNKRQYAEVPTMIKVRSPRGLKYFKELVDIMMATRGVKPKRNYQPTNFLPYLIPNGEAILATIGMSTDYLYPSMNVRGIPAEMPDDLAEYLPVIQGDELEDEEVEANIYLDTLCNHFIDGDEITLDILKELHIINKGNVLRVKARGTLDRKLIIYAEYFDEDAIKMLMCTNCTVVKIIR